MKKLLFLLLPLVGFCQDKVSVQLQDKNKSPLIGVSTVLVNLTDSTQKQFAISDTLGMAFFKVVPANKYGLMATSIGYRTLNKVVNFKQKSIVFMLEEDTKQLADVTITARKPLMQQEEDKTIVDPEPIAATSTSAFEIIEKTPGLFVDQDGNIYMNGATPANIYINGREQRMSREDIATMLKSLPPNAIEKMELMRSPSAKYDASGGNGGIINVVLKKGIKIGRNGSVNFGMSKGTFSNQNIGLNLTNVDGATSTYFNANVSNRKTFDEVITNRYLQQGDNNYSQNAYTVQPGQGLYVGYGITKEPNKKFSYGYDGRLSRNLGQNTSSNAILIQGNQSKNVVSDLQNGIANDSKSFNLNQDLSARYKLDTLGSEITSNFTYNYLVNSNQQEYSSLLKSLNNTLVGGFGVADSKRHFGLWQTDLKYKFPRKLVLEAGLKSTLQQFINVADFSTTTATATRQDLLRTNSFKYNENINAAYFQLLKTVKKTTLKAGVRLENTNMLGRQLVPTDTTFTIRRLDLFPFVYLSRPLVSVKGFDLIGTLTYNKSITRPTYEMLNPFAKYLDQFTFEVGNPGLKPQFTETYEANIVASGFPIFAVGRKFTNDIFTNVIYQGTDNQAFAFRTYDNLGKNQETYFRTVLGVPPTWKYFVVAGAEYNRNKYLGSYENKAIDFDRASWRFFTFHQIKIDKLSTVQFSGFYSLNGQQQFYQLGNFGQLNFGINRQFLNKKLFVGLNMSDIFYSNKTTFSLKQGSVEATGNRRGDTRRVGINIRHNFGLKKKEEKRGMFDGIEQ